MTCAISFCQILPRIFLNCVNGLVVEVARENVVLLTGNCYANSNRLFTKLGSNSKSSLKFIKRIYDILLTEIVLWVNSPQFKLIKPEIKRFLSCTINQKIKGQQNMSNITKTHKWYSILRWQNSHSCVMCMTSGVVFLEFRIWSGKKETLTYKLRMAMGNSAD